MATLESILAQMSAAGLPPLTPDQVSCTGEVRRYGPRKRAWYALREIRLQSGKSAIVGAFGIWQGENNHAQSVRLDEDAGYTPAEMFAIRAEMEKRAAQESVKRAEKARLAAARARQQFAAAAEVYAADHPYLARKRITAEGVKVDPDKGLLYVPMWRDGEIVGLQKIPAEGGDKFYNRGCDKAGAACVLGVLRGASVAAIGEGYATCRTVRMSSPDMPVLVAFDAGNMMHVAQRVRTKFPDLPLLLLADDDDYMQTRMSAWLLSDYHADLPASYQYGERCILPTSTDQFIDFCASIESDENGIAYIQASVTANSVPISRTFKNTGVATCAAIAAKVPNCTVCVPSFVNGRVEKGSDFNDLYVSFNDQDAGLAEVRKQLELAMSPAPPDDVTIDQPPPPPVGGKISEGEAFEETGERSDDGIQSAQAAPVKMMESVGSSTSTPAQLPLNVDEPSNVIKFDPTRRLSLSWLLNNCYLVVGQTNVWDAQNKMLLKWPAFVKVAGKNRAREWEEHQDRQNISPRELPKMHRGVAVVDPPQGGGGGGLDEVLERYVGIYGTTDVYDKKTDMRMGYDDLDFAIRGLAKLWLDSPLRKMINQDCIVFDPSETCDPDTHINRFRGWPLKPRENEELASAVIELGWHLCGDCENRAEVFRYLICWLALPLQRPGAKMQSYVIMKGETQGSGKSLLFDGIIRPIYGDYGVTGNQLQFDSRFTGWRENKMYILFEEISTNETQASAGELLKHMITGETQMVERKHSDPIEQDNVFNAVILSNRIAPVRIDPDDRRAFVIEINQKTPVELLAKLIGENGRIRSGVSEAFYHFLLNYDIGDFGAHAPAPMTAAKQAMILYCLPSNKHFFEAWQEGLLRAPYMTCASGDLYLVYLDYCRYHGERFPLSQTKLMSQLPRHLTKRRVQLWEKGRTRKSNKEVIFVTLPDSGKVDPHLDCARFQRLAEIMGKTDFQIDYTGLEFDE